MLPSNACAASLLLLQISLTIVQWAACGTSSRMKRTCSLIVPASAGVGHLRVVAKVSRGCRVQDLGIRGSHRRSRPGRRAAESWRGRDPAPGPPVALWRRRGRSLHPTLNRGEIRHRGGAGGRAGRFAFENREGSESSTPGSRGRRKRIPARSPAGVTMRSRNADAGAFARTRAFLSGLFHIFVRTCDASISPPTGCVCRPANRIRRARWTRRRAQLPGDLRRPRGRRRPPRRPCGASVRR